jgi:hypothetical protein
MLTTVFKWLPPSCAPAQRSHRHDKTLAFLTIPLNYLSITSHKKQIKFMMLLKYV